MVPTDANFMGNVFGGSILADIDRVAFITAMRHAKGNCVTASIDRVDFLRPVHVGQVVEYLGRLTGVGRTSMEVGIEARAESLVEGTSYLVADATVTMVAVDPSGHPVPVPPLTPADEAALTDAERAHARMEARRRSRPRSHGHGSVPPTNQPEGK
jgi:acyl-CoA hydrolase